ALAAKGLLAGMALGGAVYGGMLLEAGRARSSAPSSPVAAASAAPQSHAGPPQPDAPVVPSSLHPSTVELAPLVGSAAPRAAATTTRPNVGAAERAPSKQRRARGVQASRPGQLAVEVERIRVARALLSSG